MVVMPELRSLDPASPLVDFHVHVYPKAETGRREKDGYDLWEYGSRPEVRFCESDGDADETLAAFTSSGVQAGVVAHLFVPEPTSTDHLADLVASNVWVCELARRDARFVPFVSADPVIMDVRALIRHIGDLVEVGARGVKVHPIVQGLDLSDRSIWPLFEYLEAAGLPVLSHSGASRDGAPAADPDAFRPLLGAHPKLRLVLAHMGGGTWRQIPRFARDHPGVWFDCSEIIHWLGAPNAPGPEEFVELVRGVGVHRVMLGSDFPWYGIDDSVRALHELPGMSSDEHAAIAGGNAIRFLSCAP